MLLSILRDVVTVPLSRAFRATANIVKSGPFAAILEKTQNSHQDASAVSAESEPNPLVNLLSIAAGKSAQITHLSNIIREAIRQQLMSDRQFDQQGFQQDLASETRELGFDDATIQGVTLNLNRLFAELRALPPAQKHDLLEQLNDSRPDVVTPAANTGLMQ
jgi:hypothetical protein